MIDKFTGREIVIPADRVPRDVGSAAEASIEVSTDDRQNA